MDWPRRGRESRKTDPRPVVRGLDRDPELSDYYAPVGRFIDFSEENHDWFKHHPHLGYN